MKRIILHNIALCLAVCGLLSLTACHREMDIMPVATDEGTLFLNIATLEQTRATTDDLLDNEKMHTLRVVVLHQDGTVEHNKFYSVSNNERLSKYILLKVTSNETKKVFLFANEESVTSVEGVAGTEAGSTTPVSLSSFFNRYPENTPGFEAEVNNLYFAPDYDGGKNIPMSSVYEIVMPAKSNYEGTFYVVRVATKFNINFKNWHGDPVTVNSLSIAKHARKNFLMARVSNSTQNQDLFNGKSWIDWLKEVSDASSVNDDYETTEKAGWLKDYDLPSAETNQQTYTHSTFKIPAAISNETNPANSQPSDYALPAFYLPESKNPKAGATDGEQEYTMTLDIEGAPETFTFVLPNLKALFRNTNVVVNITMYANLEFEVEVIPFTSVSLAPDFGLEREKTTGFIIGKDNAGRLCWWDNSAHNGLVGPYYLGADKTITSGEDVTLIDDKYLLVYADGDDYTKPIYEQAYKWAYWKEEPKDIWTAYDKKVEGSNWSGRPLTDENGNPVYAPQINHFEQISGYERKASTLCMIIDTETSQRYFLTPDSITKYKRQEELYLNQLKQRVWLDGAYMPNPPAPEGQTLEAGIFRSHRIVFEWDRLEWNLIYWDRKSGYYPKCWFDVFGNRYSWKEGDTVEKRADLLRKKYGSIVDYLEDNVTNANE